MSRQIDFISKIIPNPLTFINGILNISKTSINDLTSDEIKNVFTYFKNIGAFFPSKINTDNYIITDIKTENDYSIRMQYNVYKNSFMKLFTMKFVMMLDYDTEDYLSIAKLLSTTKESYRIYKTFNGYHAYCTSSKYSPTDYSTLQIMKDLSCDNVYISYVKEYSFVTRISKKENRNEEYIEEYKDTIHGKEELSEILEIIKIKDTYMTSSI